jgi:hypothetical protein
VSAPDASSPSLIAYHTGVRPPWKIVPAGRWRDWMNATSARFANRCLPLLMANQSGWWLLNSHGFTATWDGRTSPAGVEISYDEEVQSQHAPAESNFGYGVVTWRVPYLFRTDPGWNLLARGPANLPKHGASALEGLIETDWSVATFTMNWCLTEPGMEVRFDAEEPICQIVPQRRFELESFAPRTAPLAENPELEEGFQSWHAARERMKAEKFVAATVGLGSTMTERWQPEYFKGTTPDGHRAEGHQTTRRLPPFTGG